MKSKKEKSSIKKPFYKKWWFWVIIVIVVLSAISGSDSTTDNKDTSKESQQTELTQSTEETKNTESAIDSIDFTVSDVRNDVTGNWRKALIAKNIKMEDYALDYYKKYFKSDDEIHAIINFNYKTTTKISVMGNLLGVTVYEYVDKEEHDAKRLFGGMLLKEYHVNMDNGEIIEIQ